MGFEMRRRIFIIAEIGNLHDGSSDLARSFIREVAGCGADAIKFQTHIFKAESLPDAPNPPYFKNESRKEYFERTTFDLRQWEMIKVFTEEECGLEFISSPFSPEAVDLLEKLRVRTYKIPSGEVTNTPLLLKVAKTGKRVLLSSGMSSWDELDQAVKTLKRNGCPKPVILQCTSEYPCPPHKVGLNVLLEMKERYKLPVGLSDHTLGIACSIAAVALGAEVIERHFTLSKSMYGTDAGHSLEPGDLKLLVKNIRELEAALSAKVNKDITAKETAGMKTVFEKSIVAATGIKKGTVLKEGHLAYKKPGDGIRADRYREIIGKTAKTDIAVDTKIDRKMLK